MDSKRNFIETVNKTSKKFIFSIRKHSPEILIVSGVIGAVAGGVWACVETLKVKEKVIEPFKDNAETINEKLDGENYTETDAKKDKTKNVTAAVWSATKLYGPPILLEALSITSILASNDILRKRAVALGAAYTAVDAGFKEYRNRVIDRYGKNVDNELRYGVKKTEKTEETINTETGRKNKTKKDVNTIGDRDDRDEFIRIFEPGNPNWDRLPDFNMNFLNMVQNTSNDKLKVDGYLFLNDVLQDLGFDRTKAGQVVGWVYRPNGNPNGDNYIDFGILPLEDLDDETYLGYALEFNVDGNILDLM